MDRMSGKMQCFGLSDIGKVRTTNEDHFLVSDLNKSMQVHQTSLGLNHSTRLYGGSQGKVLAVADGMGGHAAGERASMIAVDAVTEFLLNAMDWFRCCEDEKEEDEAVARLQGVTDFCHEQVSQDVDAAPQRKGMGTTLTLGFILWPRMFVVHVGDSRCYLLRDGEFKQISHDHTMTQYLIETGALAPDETHNSEWDHQLYNVIGGNREAPKPDVYRTTLEIGDTVLLCTDGLTKHVSDEEMAATLSEDLTAEELCESLREQALRGGGEDNITLIVARFLDLDDAADQVMMEVEESIADTCLLDDRPTDPLLEGFSDDDLLEGHPTDPQL